MVILSIDVGTVRIGCAWGDSTVGVPFPIAVWERAQGRAEKSLIAEIKNRKAELLVVGLPLGPRGERTPTCDSIEAFVARIVKRIPIRVEYIDEAFSSDDAAEQLAAAGSVRRELDAYAACLILQRFLETTGKSRP